jgi:hypothetical protein
VIGAKTNAERYCRKIEGEMAAGVYGDKKRVKWTEFRKQLRRSNSIVQVAQHCEALY